MAWSPTRTGWAATVPDGRVFLLRRISRVGSVWMIREMGQHPDFTGMDSSLGLGLAFGLDHARTMIAGYVRRYPEGF